MKLSGIITDDTGATFNLNVELSAVQPPVPEVPPVEPPVVEPPVEEAPPVEPVVQPPTASAIPLSWSAPQFANNTTIAPLTVGAGQTLENKSLEVHSEPAAIVLGDNTTLRNVRVGKAVREGVRIGSGKYTIEGCWLEARGSGADHADVIQAYAGPGGGGPLDLTVRNSTIRAYNEAATAGLFVADKVFGKVTLDNVVFYSGPFGLALYSDVNTIEVYAKDVFFVGPFGWRPIDFRDAGGLVVIKQWENVREATIVDGVLVPGKLITA